MSRLYPVASVASVLLSKHVSLRVPTIGYCVIISDRPSVGSFCSVDIAQEFIYSVLVLS